MPVITGAMGIVSKGLEKYLEKYQDNIQYILYKKIAVLGTSHIMK
jgi:hypothetical protein